METDQLRVEDADAARALLRDLDEVRGAARARRSAYWLPLLVFGILICASAPLYLRLPARVANLKQRLDPESGTLAMLGGLPDGTLTSTSVVRAAFWLAILAVGAVVTAGWYWWHGTSRGVLLRGRVPAAVLVAGTLVLFAIPTITLQAAWRLWQFTSTGVTGLFVVALGLLALCVVERSALLAVVTVIFCVASYYAVFQVPENPLHTILNALGVAPGPAAYYYWSDTVHVLMPGLVLVIGGLAALVRFLRTR